MIVTSFPTQVKADDILDVSIENEISSEDSSSDIIATESSFETVEEEEIAEISVDEDSDIIKEESSETVYLEGETTKYISVSYNGLYVSNVGYINDFEYSFNEINAEVGIPYNDNNMDTNKRIRFTLAEGAKVFKVEFGYYENQDDCKLTYRELPFGPFPGDNCYCFDITPRYCLEQDTYAEVKSIIITAGVKADIRFDEGYSFSHVFVNGSGEYEPLPDEDKHFELEQSYAENQEVYVAVDTLSDKAKFVAIDKFGNNTELEKVESYNTRTGATQIYKIIAKDGLRICEDRNKEISDKVVSINTINLSIFTAEVLTNDKVRKKDGSENEYIVNYGGNLEIVVHKPSGKKAPKATMEIYDDEQYTFTSSINNQNAGKVDYTYNINYTSLFDGKTISIIEDTDIKTVSFSYPLKKIASLTVKENNEIIDPAYYKSSRGMIDVDYEVAYGSRLEYSISANSTYVVGTVTEKNKAENSRASTFRSKNNIYRKFKSVYENCYIEIKPEGYISVDLKVKTSGGWVDAPMDRKSTLSTSYYTMYEGCTYKLTLKCGDELLDDSIQNKGQGLKSALDSCFKKGSNHILTFESGSESNPYIFTVGEISDNSSTSVRITNPGRVLSSYNIRLGVSKLPSGVIIPKKLDDEGTISCQADARTVIGLRSADKSIRPSKYSLYNIEVNPTSGCENLLDISFDPARGIIVVPKPEALNNDGVLAKVKLYRIDKTKSESDYYVNMFDNGKTPAKIDEIKIKSKGADNFKDYKVTYKKTKADDTSLYIQFTQKYDNSETALLQPVYGAQYYEIKSVPIQKANVDMPAEVKEKTVYVYRNLSAENEYFDEQYNQAFDAYCKKYENADEWPDFQEPKYKDYVTTERVKISDATENLGYAWDYNVTVRLVQTKDKNINLTESNSNEQIIFRGNPVTSKMSTMAPTYETNVKFTRNAAKVFTGQQKVKVATIGYSSTTGIRKASVEVITDCIDSEKLDLSIENDVVYANVSDGCLIGNHTIQVTPYAPENMYVNKKSVTVSVVQGISNLKINVPAEQIYKKANGSGSLTATVSYNEGLNAPNVKKVKWELVSDTADTLYDGKNVSISNGKVTVNKSFNPETDLGFRIRAVAADYTGNTTCAYSDAIAVSVVPMEIGAIKFAKYNTDTDTYSLVDESSSSVPEYNTKELNEMYLIVFRENPDRNEYSTDELRTKAIDGSLIKVTSSNKNAAGLTSTQTGYKITSKAIASTVTFNAVTTDGGNKKLTKKIKVVYAEPATLALTAKIADNNVFDENTLESSYRWTQGTAIDIQVRQKETNDSIFTDVDSVIKHTVSVKGGKIIKKDPIMGKYAVVSTGKSVEISLKDNKNVTKKYTIENKAYSADPSPKVKVGNSVVMGSTQNRKVKLSTIVKDPYTLTGKKVKIELDAEQKNNVKNAVKYEPVENSCAQMNKTIDAESELYLTFDERYLYEGKYKVWLTYGIETAQGFEADSKPVAITIAVSKPAVKKGTFSLYSSVNLKKTRGSSVAVTGKGNAQYVINSVSVNSVKNVNNKGKSNDFLHYFDVITNEQNGVYSTSFVLKAGLNDDEVAYITGKNSKNDRLCDVTYTYKHGDNGYGVSYTTKKTSRIEVKFID